MAMATREEFTAWQREEFTAWQKELSQRDCFEWIKVFDDCGRGIASVQIATIMQMDYDRYSKMLDGFSRRGSSRS